MTKVSVIIPFHNVEKYIGKCLDSVISQTLSDIEIILVNDASDDASRSIAQDYASRDGRIKIIDIPQKTGQGYARNLAFEVATGKYIGFVDSDDFIAPQMFEKLYNRAEETCSDIVMCQADLLDDKTGEIYSDDYYSLKPLKDYFDKVFYPCDVKDEILNINVVLWNKIYNRNFFNASGVKFVPGYIYEDLPFFFETFLAAQNISIVPEKLYTYRQNRVFSTMQNSDKKVYDRIPMVERTYDVLTSVSYLSDKKVEIASWVIDDIFHRYTVLEDKYYEDYYPAMKSLFSKINLNEDEKVKLSSVCYCYDEYCTVLKSTYYGFWKFLIEKYKTSNQRIRLAEHKCNLDVKAAKEKIEEFKSESDAEKEEIICDMNAKLEDERNLLTELSKKRIKNICAKVKLKLEQEEQRFIEEQEKHKQNLRNEVYKFNKMKAVELKKQSDEIKRYYKKIIKNREIYHINAMKRQKDYYENRYFPVKIVMKICRKSEQFKNKFKRILKIN